MKSVINGQEIGFRYKPFRHFLGDRWFETKNLLCCFNVSTFNFQQKSNKLIFTNRHHKQQSTMSASKRRLSKGGKAVLPLQEEELAIDEDLSVQSNSRRNSFARRRQSFGNSATVEESEESIQDQNRIADMYKSIIKMSSENVSCTFTQIEEHVIDHQIDH
jgi:hypothetical protein